MKVRLSAGQHTVNMPWVSSILTPSAIGSKANLVKAHD